MPSNTERLQAAWHCFDDENGHLATGTREATEWALEQGLLEMPEIDPIDYLAGQMANALRAEYRVDDKGRRYRVNHATRITKRGVQYTFWGVLGFADHEHMERALAQRREQIIGDCCQLKTDIDVYNDMNRGKRPIIQLVLDFADDVAEREAMSVRGTMRKQDRPEDDALAVA